MKIQLTPEDDAAVKAGRGKDITPRAVTADMTPEARKEAEQYNKALKHAISHYKWLTPVGQQSANRHLVKAEEMQRAAESESGDVDRGKADAKLEKARRQVAYRRFNTTLSLKHGSAALTDGIVHVGLTSIPVQHVSFDMIGDGPGGRTTVTRVAAGAVLAGPLGALIGAAAQKETVGMWLVVRDVESGKSAKIGFLSGEASQVDSFISKVAEAQQAR